MCRVCHTRLSNALDQFGRSKLVTTSYAYDNDGNMTQNAIRCRLGLYQEPGPCRLDPDPFPL
jgi:hypothetical protein